MNNVLNFIKVKNGYVIFERKDKQYILIMQGKT